MSLDTFSSINSILQRDSTDTTYKYSLLQSVIETCQEYPQFAKFDEETHRVHLPLGISVFKWIFYYYPFFIPGQFIALKKGERSGMHKVSFRQFFEEVCRHYESHGGISVFYDELLHGKVDPSIEPIVRKLAAKIRQAIIEGPICHLGYSQYQQEYSVFRLEESASLRKNKPLSFQSMISGYGTYSFSHDLYLVFRELGGFILGTGSIYRKWMEFLQKENSKDGISEGELLKRFSMIPETDRDVNTAAKYYHTILSREGCACFWSGKMLTESTIAIDHMLPFSVWKSNDLWNLVPADEKINLIKSDDIPSPELLESRKDELLAIWERLHESFTERFESEMSIGLLSGEFTMEWKEDAFRQLKENAEYLISVRGYGKWNYNMG